jgi:hypothetical protein
MTHGEIDTGMATVRDAMNDLPQAATVNVDAAWTRLRARMNEAGGKKRIRWTPMRVWSLAAAGLAGVAAVLVITIAPIRAWAENLLSIFRVEHVAVVDIASGSVKGLENDPAFNQAMTRFLSEEVTVTQAPQRPYAAPDVATAAKLSGFDLHLIGGETPAGIMVRSAFGAQMKLDRDRLQSIVDEAGRSDLRIPRSVDGAVIGLRVPAGVIALYGNCGNELARLQGNSGQTQGAGSAEDAGCLKLSEGPSPTASAPSDLNPAELAQVALQFTGLSATEAANFTQTIDWTSTFVLPVLHGQSSYEKVHVNGNEAILLRPANAGRAGSYALVWVDGGILYSLMGTGDATTAVNLAEKVE